MSMTRAAEARSQAVSPALMFSMPVACAAGKQRSVAQRGPSVSVRLWAPRKGREPWRTFARRGTRSGSHPLREADDVPLWVREHRELDRAGLHRGHDGLAAQPLDLGEGGLQVLGLDVEGHLALAVARRADAAADAVPVGAGVDHRVVLRRVGELPIERFAVEV